MRIDCQTHLFPPWYLDYLEGRKEEPRVIRKGGERFVVLGGWSGRLLPKLYDIKEKLRAMDEAGVDLGVLSINNPGPELLGDDGPGVASRMNDFIAELVAAHPDRFVGLAILPVQDAKASLAELERCVSDLGMRGVLLYSNVAGRPIDAPELRPLYKRVEELGIPICLHPTHPVMEAVTRDYGMSPMVGFMFDTSIAMLRLILSGIMEAHPRLKVVLPHVGGTLPYLMGRIEHQTEVLGRGRENIRKPPSAYFSRVYLDTVSPLPLAIRYGYDFAGPDRLLFGSDHPWLDVQPFVTMVEELSIPQEDKRKIFSENAKSLFGIR
jgi:predicted TIM-barrel fold metal-dependent hydrolase